MGFTERDPRVRSAPQPHPQPAAPGDLEAKSPSQLSSPQRANRAMSSDEQSHSHEEEEVKTGGHKRAAAPAGKAGAYSRHTLPFGDCWTWQPRVVCSGGIFALSQIALHAL